MNVFDEHVAGNEEDFYTLLRIERNATIAEIVNAYHQAKNAFSKDSAAIYSLFSTEESQAMLAKLEQAYMTLSNIDRKREYDRKLGSPGQVDMHRGEPAVQPNLGLVRQNEARQNPLNPPTRPMDFDRPQSNIPASWREPAVTPPTPYAFRSENRPSNPTTTLTGNPLEIGNETVINGAFLRSAREHQGLGMEDVARITKIPLRYLKAMESDDKPAFPSRVYLQGFLKNLGSLYRLNSQLLATKYLSQLDDTKKSVSP